MENTEEIGRHRGTFIERKKREIEGESCGDRGTDTE
jgi:hypothetical protein